jgi:hypothetical protein
MPHVAPGSHCPGRVQAAPIAEEQTQLLFVSTRAFPVQHS